MIESAKVIAEQSGKVAVKFVFSLAYRMAIGLGNSSIYENGITLHHVWGFPYLPGSAFKGIVHNWILEGKVWQEKYMQENEFARRIGAYEQQSSDGNEAQEGNNIEYDWECIFGKKDGKRYLKGEVQFFDIIPFGMPLKIEVDIVNPHYQKYYENPGKYPPADWYQPVPSAFLTVCEGSSFQTIILVDKEYCKLVKQVVQGALTEWGIGGKTRSGYGQIKDFRHEEIYAPPAADIAEAQVSEDSEP